MNIASRGATMAVDWEQRVDFDRLRTARLARTKASLEASELGSLLLFDPNNLRYVTSTAIGTWERDKNIRFALVPRGGDPILWDFGSAAGTTSSTARGCRSRAGGRGCRRCAGRCRIETGMPDALAAMIYERAPRARARGGARRHRRPRHDDAARAAAQGHRGRRLAAGDARGAQAQDRGRARPARPCGGDRRRRLRGDLPDAAAGRDREPGRRRGDEGAVRARLGARRGDQRDLRRPLQPASAHVRRPAAATRATRRSSTSSTRSWATGRATTARSTSSYATPSQLDAYKQLPRVARRRDRPRPAGRHDRQDRRGLADGGGDRA